MYADSTLVKANASLDSVGARALVEQRLASVEDHLAALWQENDDAAATERESGPTVLPFPESPTAELVEGAAPMPASPAGRAEPAAGEAMEAPPVASGPHPLGPEDRPNGSQGWTNDLLVSRTDPDAGVVVRDGAPLALYHKTHVGVDGGRARIITAVDVTSGDVADEDLLDRLRKEHTGSTGRTLTEAVADAKYGTYANCQALEAAGLRASIPPHLGRGTQRAVASSIAPPRKSVALARCTPIAAARPRRAPSPGPTTAACTTAPAPTSAPATPGPAFAVASLGQSRRWPNSKNATGCAGPVAGAAAMFASRPLAQ